MFRHIKLGVLDALVVIHVMWLCQQKSEDAYMHAEFDHSRNCIGLE